MAPESVELLRAIVDSVRDSIIVTDATGHIIYWNRGAERVFGFTAEEMLGKTPASLYPDLDPRELARDLEKIQDGGSFVGEWRGRKKNGESVWLEIETRMLVGEDRRPGGFIGIGKDVTDRRRADAQRAAALTLAEDASRAKDEFLAMLGHELRNPLSPIVTALQLMKLKGDSQASRELKIIERQVEHVVRLVDDLLDVSRITRGNVDLKRTTFEVSDAIANAVEMASPLLEQRGHRLALSVPRAGLVIEGDPGRLAQVISNLLTNAAKYTPPDGAIELRAFASEADVVVSVADNGIGIDDDLLPHVFELFVQGRRAADRPEGGLGIGLALVKNLVHMHGGTVVARSRAPAPGTEFTVRLPAVRPVSSPDLEQRAGSSIPPTTQRRRILVIDDNVDAAELIGEMLRAAGHEVIVGHDGPTALRLLSESAPDIAVLDIGLPVMDGYELARRIRDGLGPRTPRLIAVTGYGQELDRSRSAQAGFDEHLVKPVSHDVLLNTIERGAGVNVR